MVLSGYFQVTTNPEWNKDLPDGAIIGPGPGPGLGLGLGLEGEG